MVSKEHGGESQEDCDVAPVEYDPQWPIVIAKLKKCAISHLFPPSQRTPYARTHTPVHTFPRCAHAHTTYAFANLSQTHRHGSYLPVTLVLVRLVSAAAVVCMASWLASACVSSKLPKP